MLEGLRMDHVGMVVRDIRAHFADHLAGIFGPAALGPLIDDPLQKVKVAFVEVPGGRLELIEPTAGDSPVSAALARRPAGLHHVCFGVRDLDAQLETCRRSGMVVASDPKPAVAFGGRRIAFVLGRDRLLWELLEDR